MSSVLNSLGFFLMLFHTSLWAQTNGQDAEAKSLVFRLTGDDAIPLRAFLQERMPQKVDFKKIKYFGDLNSLACSERDDCFLWLSRLEWQDISQNKGQPTRLAFTLPFRETALKGIITLDVLPTGERNVGLQLQDLNLRPGTWELQPKTCAFTDTPKTPPLLQRGECRIEFAGPLKKVVPYTPSVQFLQNAENIVLSFAGTTARQRFESRPDEIDPFNEARRRVQLGPQSYCWNLEPTLPPGMKPEAYVCQAAYRNAGVLDFVDASTGTSLQFHFSSDIAQTVTVETDDIPAGTCPISTKVGTDLRCTVLYNWKGAFDVYPLGNPVQGVAVGWGVALN